MFMAHHGYALLLEHIMRSAFNLKDRGGLGGVADADYADSNPFSAICCTLSSYYNNVDDDKKALINTYIDKYYFCKDDTIEKIGEKTIDKMIDELRELLKKIK